MKSCHLCQPRMDKLVPTYAKKSEVNQSNAKVFGLVEEEELLAECHSSTELLNLVPVSIAF